MKVLGIETSCDETGVAIYDSENGLLANLLHTQINVHKKYGGVVPELASRDHIRHIVSLTNNVIKKANCSLNDIDGIAYTGGPGLIGSLLVGASFAKSLSLSLKIPAIAVNHMEGHLLAPMLESISPEVPFVALLISGGHTQLFQVSKIGEYKLLGETLDDAIGEAFDKTAKLLGLQYPGGPALEKLATQGETNRFYLPRPMINRPGLNFSFSGLKTAALNIINNNQPLSIKDKASIALSFQEAIGEVLFVKCKRALQKTNLKRLIVAGGVSANLYLRHSLNELSHNIGCEIFYPRMEFCTDNGAMIAYAGCQHLFINKQSKFEIKAYAKWPLENLST